MKLKIDKEDCLLNDLKIPEGYRVIEDWELMKELRTNKEMQKIFKRGIWINRVVDGKKCVRASWLNNFNYDSLFIVFGRNIDNVDRVRGVFVKNDDTNK